MGTYFANNKFLFIDHISTIDRQRNEGTLLSGSNAMLPLWATQVNRLTAEQQLHLQQGPMRSCLAEWWRAGTTKERLIRS
eukprot:2001378-Prorocentrum_lima.AAC.1